MVAKTEGYQFAGTPLFLAAAERRQEQPPVLVARMLFG